MNTMQYREANPLRRWRRLNNATQGLVASQVHKTLPNVSNWESGDVMPTPQSLLELAAIMGADYKELSELWQKWFDARPSIKRR